MNSKSYPDDCMLYILSMDPVDISRWNRTRQELYGPCIQLFGIYLAGPQSSLRPSSPMVHHEKGRYRYLHLVPDYIQTSRRLSTTWSSNFDISGLFWGVTFWKKEKDKKKPKSVTRRPGHGCSFTSDNSPGIILPHQTWFVFIYRRKTLKASTEGIHNSCLSNSTTAQILSEESASARQTVSILIPCHPISPIYSQYNLREVNYGSTPSVSRISAISELLLHINT